MNESLCVLPSYRNLAISKKRINLPNDRLCSAINSLDGNSLNPEYVDILLRFIPTDEDKKKYRGMNNNLTWLTLSLISVCSVCLSDWV